MKKLITASTTFIVFLFIFVLSINSKPIRLLHDVVPVEQSIYLKINPDESHYSGTSLISLDVRKKSESFLLHSETIEIQSVQLLSGDKNITCTYEQFDETKIKIIPETLMELGKYLLEIEFVNNFDTQANSVYRMETEGEAYVYSQLEADEAREAFPCFDEPIFKIPYQMTMTIPEQDFAVTNTPIESQKTSDGWTTIQFKKSKPMPSYLIAVAVGPFEFVEMPNMPIPSRVVTPKGKSHLTGLALETTPPILKALEKYFESPYPYEKLDLIAVPEFWPGAMENPGAVTYSAGLLLIDEHSTSRQKLRQTSVTAHELAHMWFGDLVTMEWWDDLWLNESFANWMGNKITHEVSPEFENDISRSSAANSAMIGDARQAAIAIRQPIESMSDLLSNIGAVYSKGEAVLNMFEKRIGKEKFRKGIVSYINEHAWGNATASDLWNSLEDVADFDLPDAMATFINQPGVPLLTIEKEGENNFKISQKRFANYNNSFDESFKWNFPVTIKYASSSTVKTETIFVNEKSQSISLSADGDVSWIMPNVGAGGYFRWVTPPEMLIKLAKNADELMTPIERKSFLQNSSALLDAGLINGSDFLEIISHFDEEQNMLVMSTVIGSLSSVEGSFLTDDYRDEFAVFVNKILKNSMDKIGYEPSPNETERTQMLRPSFISLLAQHGKNQDALSFAEKQFKKFMESPDSVDPSIIAVSVGLACIQGDLELFNECKERFEKAQIPSLRQLYLGALGSFEDTTIQALALQYALDGPLRPQEFFTIPRGVAGVSEERANYVFEWMTQNFDVILKIVPVQYHTYLPYFAGGCSAERIALAQKFFGVEDNQVQGTLVQLAKVSEQVQDCITLRDRERDNVEKYLKEFVVKQN